MLRTACKGPIQQLLTGQGAFRNSSVLGKRNKSDAKTLQTSTLKRSETTFSCQNSIQKICSRRNNSPLVGRILRSSAETLQIDSKVPHNFLWPRCDIFAVISSRRHIGNRADSGHFEKVWCDLGP